MSPSHGHGTARRGAANSSGVALHAARRIKEATYPELSGEAGRARLVVLAAEVGRWSQEASIFLSDLAKARAQAAPLMLQGRVHLLERRPVPGAGEDAPSLDVVLRDARFQ